MPSDDHILIGNHAVIQRPENNELLVAGPDDKESVVRLSPEEFMLFRILNDNRGREVEREYLLNVIWSGEKKSKDLLEKTAYGLTRKLEDAGIHEDFIETAPGKGFRLLFNENIEDEAGADRSLRTKISTKILWALLIIIILAGILFIVDLSLPEEEEVPDPPAEIDLPSPPNEN